MNWIIVDCYIRSLKTTYVYRSMYFPTSTLKRITFSKNILYPIQVCTFCAITHWTKKNYNWETKLLKTLEVTHFDQTAIQIKFYFSYAANWNKKKNNTVKNKQPSPMTRMTQEKSSRDWTYKT